MFNTVLTGLLFALYAVGVPGVGWVVLVFGLLNTLLWILMSAAKCGAIPNIFDSTTWPPCKCED